MTHLLNMDVINYTWPCKRPEQRLLMSAKYDTAQRRFSVWKNTKAFKQMRKKPHSSGMNVSSARGFLAFEVHCNKTDWTLKLFTASNGERVLWIHAPILWEKTYNVPLCLHNLYFRLQKSIILDEWLKICILENVLFHGSLKYSIVIGQF